MEESRLRGDGSKVITKQGRQSLARVSVLDGRVSNSEATALVIMDDYVVQSEPVVDHLTRFSGITAGALNIITRSPLDKSVPSISLPPFSYLHYMLYTIYLTFFLLFRLAWEAWVFVLGRCFVSTARKSKRSTLI